MTNITIIGHRGARGLAPENTAASLLKALEHRVDEVEIDVRVTQNHIPILAHDKHVLDPSGNKLVIRKHTYAELKAHKSDLLTLEEAVRTIRKRVPMIIEVKPGEPTACIIKALQTLMKKGLKPDDIRLASFSLRTLKALHKAFPSVTIVVNEHWSGVRATHRARKFGTKRIALSRLSLWRGFIKAMRRGDYELSAYTLNDLQKANKWKASGLFGVVTDYPDQFVKK